jgi:LysR family transcriptional regulator for metE and metH
MMLQLVAAGRGVTVLPDWLIRADAGGLALTARRIGALGLHKSITLGIRAEDAGLDYVKGLIAAARRTLPSA